MGMSASQIKIGGQYAIEHKGHEVRFYVREHITKRDGHKTKNYFNGTVFYDEYEKNNSIAVEDVMVGQFLGEFEQHKELVEKKKLADKVRKDAEENSRNLKRAVCDILNELMGYDKTDWKKADDDWKYGNKLPIQPTGWRVEIRFENDEDWAKLAGILEGTKQYVAVSVGDDE